MPATNPVIDAIKSRRAIRKFQPKQIPEELVNELLQAAVYSPTAMNTQGWRFVVVKDPVKIKELSDDVKRLAPKYIGIPLKLAERFTSREDLIFYGAPLLILVTASKKAGPWAGIDCGILAQTLFLAAKSLGLGSCFIGFAQSLNSERGILKGLGVPEGHEIVAPLIFGYPAEEKPVPERTFEDKVLKRY